MKHKLHFPDAIEWMWNYCTYVGSFTDSSGNQHDLGFHLEYINDNQAPYITQAIVYGNEAGDYVSGRIHDTFEVSAELKRRLIYLKIIAAN